MTRSALNYDRNALSEASGITFNLPSKTVQSERDSTDINNIVREFGLTGKLPQAVRLPSYEDFTDAVTDYQTAANALREADAAFLTIPAGIRSRFHNDPQAFLEFATKKENLDELRSMGLADPPAVQPETPPVRQAKKPEPAPANPSE